MMTETDTLVVGVEHDGITHLNFELRPQLVKDSIEAVEDERAQKNESYLGLAVLSKQVIRLGNIPQDQITPELFMGMYDVDLARIAAASERLQKRLISFRGEGKGLPEDGTGPGKTGVQL